MMLCSYNFTAALAAPILYLYLKLRLVQGKEDPARFSERLGISSIPRPDGPLIWLHGASVGEAISLLPLIDRLRQEKPSATFLITTGTVTSARLMTKRLPKGVIHQFVPVDRRSYVQKFLDHWQPNLILWAESDFWPNLICEPARRNIPMVLVNGRVSANSFKGWMRFKGTMTKLLSGFTLCLGQTNTDVERLISLGAPLVKCRGNLKFAVPPLPAKESHLDTLKKEIAGRPIWVAASTHQGEEEIIARAHIQLSQKHPGLLSIVIPRHAARGEEIARILLEKGLKVSRRSQAHLIEKDTDIYIGDTMGELGLFYRLASIIFMGKSLVPLGGQNPLEAMRLNCAVIHGPYMTNFAEMVDRMTKAETNIKITNEDELIKSIDTLLSNSNDVIKLAKKARTFAKAEEHILSDVMDELKPFIKNLSNRSDPHASS